MENFKKIAFIGFFGFALLLSGCVEFKEITLYDGVKPPPEMEKPEMISKVVEPLVYDDNPSDMWGIEDEVCKRAEYTSDVVYSGTQAIKISWDRNEEGCIFAGFGIGWDGWAGKDLTQIMDHAAFRFYVRTTEGRAFGLPIVLTLEDYSGGMGFCYTANKYFERTFIDTVWQKIEVPLADFDLDTENLDITNVKQLQFELQQAGSVFIDDISLVFYEAPEVEPWLEEEVLPDPLDMPVTIFDDAFINDNGWGIMDYNCRTVEITDELAFKGTKAISAKWNDTGDCDVMFIAASWNKWNPIDFTKGNYEDFAFEFYIYNRGEASSDLNLRFGLTDYNGNYIATDVTAEYADTDLFNQSWTHVYIPITELRGLAIDYSDIKQLGFKLINSGDLLIDEIRMVRRTVN
jgi:hypothetical protein